MKLILCCLVLAAGARQADAQRRIVVDATGGPGSDYLQVQPAVDAARPGDRIEVRPAPGYTGFVVSRGIDVEVLGTTDVPGFEVAAVPDGERAQVGGFRCAYFRVRGCRGAVSVQRVTLTHARQTEIDASPSVHLREIATNPAATPWVVASALWIRHPDTCVWIERSVLRAPQSAVAVQVDGARLVVVDSTLHGGRGADGIPNPFLGCRGMPWSLPQPGAPAIDGYGRAVLMNGTRVTGGAGGSWVCGTDAAQGPAIRFAGPVHHGLDTVFSGSTPPMTSSALPVLDAPGDVALGAFLQIDLGARPGSLLITALGLGLGCLEPVGVHVPFLLSLDAIPFASAVASASGTARVTVPVPPAPALRDLTVYMQALELVDARTLEFTNPRSVRLR